MCGWRATLTKTGRRYVSIELEHQLAGGKSPIARPLTGWASSQVEFIQYLIR